MKIINAKSVEDIINEAKKEFKVGQLVTISMNPKKLYDLEQQEALCGRNQVAIPYDAIVGYSIEVKIAKAASEIEIAVTDYDKTPKIDVKKIGLALGAESVSRTAEIIELFQDYFVIKAKGRY